MSGVFGAMSSPTHRFRVGRETKHRAPFGEWFECVSCKNILSPENLFTWAMAGGPGLTLNDLLFSE